MIDSKRITEEFEATADLLERKKFPRERLAEVREALEAPRRAIAECDQRRADSNTAAKQIGALMREGKREEAEQAKQEAAARKADLQAAEEALAEAESRARALLLTVPNLPQPGAPVGHDGAANVTLRTVGYDPADYEGRDWKPHWEIGAEKDILDMERGAKISGAMFAIQKGRGARLLRALIDFARDLNAEHFTEMVVPHFVTTESFTGTGHLPKAADDAYAIERDDLWAIPTGEVPLTALHRDEILDGESLPRRYMTHTACFRRESGAAGKDTRGMQRLHEFHKLEMVAICRPETVEDEFKLLVGQAEKALQALGLPYRVLDLCTGDIPFSAARVYDLEVYAPGVDRWLEVSSVGIFTDFQARRGNIRFRDSGGKPQHPYFLNGSALATPRVWAAVLEHGLQPDGSIQIPEPLVRYCGFDRIY